LPPFFQCPRIETHQRPLPLTYQSPLWGPSLVVGGWSHSKEWRYVRRLGRTSPKPPRKATSRITRHFSHTSFTRTLPNSAT
jgi:hypothetical protein